MTVTPTADGALSVRQPAPDLRYDMGNLRLFAACDARGRITAFQLPEGIAVLRRWDVDPRLDGVPVQWREAEALGRRWTLRGAVLGVQVTLRTVCDGASAALAQQWELHNAGHAARTFTLNLDVAFDLGRPDVQVGASPVGARLYRLVREHPAAHRLLGYRRWRVLDWIGNAQKRLRAQPGGNLRVTTLHDGVQVQGDITATLRAGVPLQAVTPHDGGARLRWRVTLRPGETLSVPVIVATGPEADADPGRVDAIRADADAYAVWLSGAFECADPLLRSLYVAALNVVLAMYKELPSGFAGLWAGPGYAFPPRIYFRDSYWTALNVLPYRPEWVRRHLLSLAEGVHADGTCPSGVIDRAILPFEDQDTPGAADWLPDHHDSPAFFVLLLHDYVLWTGDMALLDQRVEDGRTLWACARAALRHLTHNPGKAHAPNDWADNVLRSEWVTYDLGLLVGALHAAADLARLRGDDSVAATYAQDARQVARLLDVHTWDAERGYYIDYRRTRRPAYAETHLALDTLVALRYAAAPPERAESVLDHARTMLQTRHNDAQPYGDWGVMCCFPPYGNPADLFAKSARAYNYHNGAEWPYLNAIYAQVLLERDDPDWRYVLTRWWALQLERDQLTPLEYHTPAYPDGAPLQGWSGMAVSAMLCGGLNLRPAPGGTISPRVPPWGASTFRHLVIRGQPRTVTVADGAVTIT